MGKICDDADTGACFFADCFEKLKTRQLPFKSASIPMTKTKKEVIIDSLDPVLVFLKNEFVLKCRAINMKFAAFYKRYKKFCKDSQVKKVSAIKVSKILEHAKLLTSKGTHNVAMVMFTRDALRKAFETSNYISDLDEFIEQDEVEGIRRALEKQNLNSQAMNTD